MQLYGTQDGKFKVVGFASNVPVRVHLLSTYYTSITADLNRLRDIDAMEVRPADSEPFNRSVAGESGKESRRVTREEREEMVKLSNFGRAVVQAAGVCGLVCGRA